MIQFRQRSFALDGSTVSLNAVNLAEAQASVRRQGLDNFEVLEDGIWVRYEMNWQGFWHVAG